MKKVLTALACALLTVSYNLYADEERGIEEILVTAQRTTQSIQDVPIAVSAFSSESLEEKQIDAFSDLRFQIFVSVVLIGGSKIGSLSELEKAFFA